MPRLAWFTPLPPVRSGIAQYSRELLPDLSCVFDIDVFESSNAHDFLWKHRQTPYELIVYQLGNAPCHDYMWAYLMRYPGLVVLHDGQLHHARGRTLLQQWPQRQEEYRSEFWFNHPDTAAEVAQLGAAGLLGSLTYLYPMLRAVVESSRRILVHNRWLADQIRDAHSDSAVDVVEMGVPESAPRNSARQEIRSRHGIAADAIVFTAFGRVTPEKRIREALRALASIASAAPQAHLLLAGESVDYYNLRADAHTLGIEQKVTMAGYVADEDVDDYLAASDVCLIMRWPTSRETSASWLRCLAAGKPSISSDLVHTVDIPTMDPRTWTVLHARGAGLQTGTTGEAGTTEETAVGPVGVSIDILDEDHSLGLAMWRLATDARLRSMLGSNARQLWSRRFRLEQMVSGYRDAIDKALATPAPDSSNRAHLPTHFLADGTEHTGRLLREAGLSDALRSDLWMGRTE